MIDWVLKLTTNLILAFCPDTVRILNIEKDVIARVKVFLNRSPFFVRYGFLLLLLLIEFQTLLRFASFKRMSSLPTEKRRKILNLLMVHPFMIFSSAIKILKTIVDIGFYDHPKIRKKMNYNPEEYIEFVKNRRLEKYGERPEFHQE